MIFGAAYLLWLYQRTMLGEVTNPKNLRLPDLSLREWAVFAAADRLGDLDRRLSEAVLRHLEKPVAQIVERVRPGYFAQAVQSAQRCSQRPRRRPRHSGGCPMSQFYTATDHFVLVPAIMLALFGCAVLLFDFLIFPEPKQRKWLLLFVVLGVAFAGYGLWHQQSVPARRASRRSPPSTARSTVDGFSLFFNWIFLVATLHRRRSMSYRYLEIEGEHHGEYYGLILLAQVRHVLPGHRHRPGHAVRRPGD